eukprot:gene12130-biopygen15473
MPKQMANVQLMMCRVTSAAPATARSCLPRRRRSRWRQRSPASRRHRFWWIRSTKLAKLGHRLGQLHCSCTKQFCCATAVWCWAAVKAGHAGYL